MKLEVFIKQLENIAIEYKEMAVRAQQKDLSDLPKVERQALVTKAVAAVVRCAGPKSSYAEDTARLIEHQPHLHMHLSSVMGVAAALLADLRAGYVESLSELAHADVFADFLEMAQHLLEEKYKDASAVIAGSSLEAHLRALCTKNNVAVEVVKANSEIVSKKADAMNSELAAAQVYDKLEQKSVTAWLDLRNRAAHGKYAEYDHGQVSLLVAGVRDFIRRHPA